VTGPALLPDWQQLEQVIPQITGPMCRYLEQVACVLRHRRSRAHAPPPGLRSCQSTAGKGLPDPDYPV